MQTYQISTKCSRCDILLDGRDQFVGHMIHSHDMLFEQASAVWKSMCDSVDAAGDNKPLGNLPPGTETS